MTEADYLSQDEHYRQARVIFDARLDYWRASQKPALYFAFQILQILADDKYGKAYYPLSRLCDTNRDDEENQDRARHFAQLAFDWCYANRDNQDAELWGDLGNMYLHGVGFEENVEEAVLWHRKAAEHGYAESQWELGHMYAFGIGVPEDGKEVEKWWRLAAAQGHGMALINLALTYECGQHGVHRDYEEAAKWYRVAADQGEYSAQRELCKMYVAGRGVPQNYEEAGKLFTQLLDRGYELTTDLILVQEILRLQKERGAHFRQPRKSQDQIQEDLIHATYLCLKHSGGTTPFQNILDAVGTAAHRQGITQWAETFAPVILSEGKLVLNKSAYAALDKEGILADFDAYIVFMGMREIKWYSLAKKIRRTPWVGIVSGGGGPGTGKKR